jgi:hypothetical protein
VTATTNSSGTAVFPGVYRPGAYTVVQTAAAAGQSFDPAPRTLVVGTAHSVAERDTTVWLPLGEPVSTTSAAPDTTPATSASAGASAGASVAAQTVAAGKQQTVTLGGFQPHEMVHGVLHSTPVDLGTVQADAAGFATFTFTIPAGLESGIHSVTMTGLTSGATAEATFTVTAGAQSTGGLAYTGTDVLPLLAVGGGLLVAGAAGVTIAGRRRSA